MATCDMLQIGGAVSLKYKTCKQDLNFQQGSDEAFVDFLLDTSVKVIDIMKHLTPVLQVVNVPSTAIRVDPPAISSAKQPKVSNSASSDYMSCRPSVHRPLFQPAPPHLHVMPRHWPEAVPVRTHQQHRSSNFVQKLPNFVRPSVSKDHHITEKSFINFKCNPKVSTPISIPAYEESEPINPNNDSKPCENTHSIPPPINHDNNDLVESSVDQGSNTTATLDTAKTIEHLNEEISQFEKEIGNVLESLTQSSSDRDTVVNKLKNSNRVSMVGMRYSDQPGPSCKRSKVSYTRLNSRYKKYPDEMLKQAMQSVQLGYKTVAQAAKEYSIPRQTLQYRLFKRKKKFHVFAPNIPYTNNFFIENYNNTSSANTDLKDLVSMSIKSEPQNNTNSQAEPQQQTPLENFAASSIVDSSALLVDEGMRLTFERTVQEMLGSESDIIRKSDGHVESEDAETSQSENILADNSAIEQTNSSENQTDNVEGTLERDTIRIKEEMITLIEMTEEMQT